MSLDKKAKIKRLRSANFIDSMNAWVGSWFFLMVHVVWFIIWLAMGLDIDMLTMIVSLEAIMLVILLLMAQNRQAIRDDHRDQADLEADLRGMEIGEKILREVRSLKRDVKDLQKK